jgi:hypothetical protein
MEWIFRIPKHGKQISAILAGDRQDRVPTPDEHGLSATDFIATRQIHSYR